MSSITSNILSVSILAGKNCHLYAVFKAASSSAELPEEEIISADSILPSLPIRKRTMDTPSILLLRSLIGYFGVGLFTILGGIAGLL